MPEIRLEDVTKIYPFVKTGVLFGRKRRMEMLKQQQSMPYLSNEGVVALQHCDLTVRDGEFVVILGPSGAGKSTLLRIIAGLERPSLGTVFFDGKDYTSVKPEDRDVSMVFQNYSLYPNQTVYQNIAFPLEVKHTPREELDREVREVADLLRIGQLLDKLPQDLSGGERQRTSLARALVRRPSVMLFDEPFSNLDVLLRRQLRNELKRIHQAYGTTFVYVTHYQNDALALADRIVILRDGIVQMVGKTSEVYDRPANRYCAEFMGLPVTNFFDGIPVSKDGVFTVLGRENRLTREQMNRLKGSGTVDAGIRGTAVSISREGYPATVKDVDLIEADLIVHLNADGREVTAVKRTAGSNPLEYRRGQKVFLTYDPEKLLLFDASGNRI